MSLFNFSFPRPSLLSFRTFLPSFLTLPFQKGKVRKEGRKVVTVFLTLPFWKGKVRKEGRKVRKTEERKVKQRHKDTITDGRSKSEKQKSKIFCFCFEQKQIIFALLFALTSKQKQMLLKMLFALQPKSIKFQATFKIIQQINTNNILESYSIFNFPQEHNSPSLLHWG